MTRDDLPQGTVTFLFTDVEGSTKLLHDLGTERYAAALAEHRRRLRAAFASHGGVEVDTQGDAFFVAFPTAEGAVAAARQAVDDLAETQVRVRIGVHTGSAQVGDEGYVGPEVHRAARIAAAGHGGQILVSAATAALIGTAGLRDLGQHRLKDLSAAERIYQLGPDTFPRLKTLYQANLPVPSTPFVGRDRELEDIAGLVTRADVRCVTLTGPGGIGKSRLALQSAGSVAEDYPDGVWWVPLAALRDPALVMDAAGRLLGAQDGVAEHIGDKRMLLLFDNFEQVIDAATDLAALIADCPNVSLIVTSREPLHITGEQEYPVSPLDDAAAVELFTARARAAVPDFTGDEHVPEICRRLDRLPLALELAAARVKSLSTAQILSRLEQRLPLLTGGARDLPERQRTLRGAIAWSYELLKPDEQRLFARLAVFRGGWTVDAAEQVADADLDTLQSLVDKSLVRHRDGRYSMLETVREYAQEVLSPTPEAASLVERHAAHFLALAEDLEADVRGGSPAGALGALESEHDNLRAALDRLTVSGEGERAQRLAGALWRFWYLHGHLAEGRRRFEVVLALDDTPSAARAKAFTGASVMAFNLGDDAGARRHIDAALELYRAQDDEAGVAYALMMLGNLADSSGDRPRARELYTQSVEQFQRIGDTDREGIARDNLASIVMDMGDLPEALRLCEQNLRLARAIGDARLEAMALGCLGGVAWRDGRPGEALELFRQSLRYWHAAGVPQFLAREMTGVARVLAMLGEGRLAARLVGRSKAVYEDIGAVDPIQLQYDAETLALVTEQLGAAETEVAVADGRQLALDTAVRLALGEGP